MSGGQQQRVAIARAVAAKPPIIMVGVRRLAAVERHALPSRVAKAVKGCNVPRRGTEL